MLYLQLQTVGTLNYACIYIIYAEMSFLVHSIMNRIFQTFCPLQFRSSDMSLPAADIYSEEKLYFSVLKYGEGYVRFHSNIIKI